MVPSNYWQGDSHEATRNSVLCSTSRWLKKRFADFATFVPLEQGMGVAMRGDDQICGSLFSYIDLEARVETGHPLRAIREIANTALAALSRAAIGALP